MGYRKENSAYTEQSQTEHELKEEVKKEEVKKEEVKEEEVKKVREEEEIEQQFINYDIDNMLNKDIVLNDREEYIVESYDDDREYREYVNNVNRKRKESTIGNLSVSILDVIDNINKRLMYLEYKNEMSYEEDKNDYIDYNSILTMLRN